MDYNQRWWEASRTNLYSDVFASLKALNDKQDYTTALNLVYARLYGNYQMYGLDAYNYARVEASANLRSNSSIAAFVPGFIAGAGFSDK